MTITHAVSQEEASILDGYTLTIQGRAQAQVTLPQEPSAQEISEESGEAPAA